MDRPITASEANQRFSELIRDVVAGTSFTVTSRGRPVARVIPIEREQSQRRAVARLLAHVERLPLRRAGEWTRVNLYE